eukprot:11137161-Alexandrium_andersonii.AAC.1
METRADEGAEVEAADAAEDAERPGDPRGSVEVDAIAVRAAAGAGEGSAAGGPSHQDAGSGRPEEPPPLPPPPLPPPADTPRADAAQAEDGRGTA